MTQQQIETYQEQFLKANDQVSYTLTNALCQTFKEITGSSPSQQLREKIYDALQFDR